VVRCHSNEDDSLPSLGDPEPEFFGKTTPPSISLIRAATFKRLIDAGEEVYTIISSRPAIIWISWPCELSAINPPQRPLCTLSPFLPMRRSSSPKLSLRHIRTFSMCSQEKRLRTCLLITSLIMKFTSRMTRPLMATSIRSLAQSSVSFTNYSMTCLARVHPIIAITRCAPVLFAKKKDGTLRLCVDF